MYGRVRFTGQPCRNDLTRALDRLGKWLACRDLGIDCQDALDRARAQYLAAVAEREGVTVEQAVEILRGDYLWVASAPEEKQCSTK
jgi:hypothetical protein